MPTEGSPPPARHSDGQALEQPFAFGHPARTSQPCQFEALNADVRVLEEVSLPVCARQQLVRHVARFDQTTDAPSRQWCPVAW